MSTLENLTGQVFGRLTVLCRGANAKLHGVEGTGQTQWFCRCDCGKECLVRAAFLKRGNTRSCGCYKLETSLQHVQQQAVRNTEDPEVMAGNAVIRQYKNSAKDRGIEMFLSDTEIRTLIFKCCHYCGRSPRKPISLRRKGQVVGLIMVNGIDRKDSNDDYSALNCVSCCKICNYAKRSMPYDEFLAYLSDVVSFRKVAA